MHSYDLSRASLRGAKLAAGESTLAFISGDLGFLACGGIWCRTCNPEDPDAQSNHDVAAFRPRVLEELNAAGGIRAAMLAYLNLPDDRWFRDREAPV